MMLYDIRCLFSADFDSSVSLYPPTRIGMIATNTNWDGHHLYADYGAEEGTFTWKRASNLSRKLQWLYGVGDAVKELPIEPLNMYNMKTGEVITLTVDKEGMIVGDVPLDTLQQLLKKVPISWLDRVKSNRINWIRSQQQ